jgi:hypothetical protein
MRTRVNPLQHFVAKLLQKPQYAWYATIPMSCFDLTAWLSLTIIMLIILRQGLKSAWNLMCANFVVHGLALYWVEPGLDSWVNAFMDFWPGYIAAFVLLYFRNWVSVAYAIVLMSGVFGAGLDFFFPHYAIAQLNLMLHAANKLNLPLPVSTFTQVVKQNQDLSIHLILGLQMLSAAFNAIISLTMARSIQSQLFYPMGFIHEMLNLRGCRWLLVSVLVSMFLVWGMGSLIPLYFIPTVLMYFFAVGMSIGVSALSKYRVQLVMMALTLAAFVLPYVMIPTFVVLGALDSVMNFRALLAKRLKPTI